MKESNCFSSARCRSAPSREKPCRDRGCTTGPFCAAALKTRNRANVNFIMIVKLYSIFPSLAEEGPLEEPSADLSNSPTDRALATDAGVILGTAAYMSPEQARGKKVDKRADIWALGCLLYELLTGKQAFDGETVTETLAA